MLVRKKRASTTGRVPGGFATKAAESLAASGVIISGNALTERVNRAARTEMGKISTTDDGSEASGWTMKFAWQ